MLFGFSYMTLDDALNRSIQRHPNTMIKLILSGNVFTCGAPALKFGDENKVEPCAGIVVHIESYM